jgi:hypothetical protein
VFTLNQLGRVSGCTKLDWEHVMARYGKYVHYPKAHALCAVDYKGNLRREWVTELKEKEAQHKSRKPRNEQQPPTSP